MTARTAPLAFLTLLASQVAFSVPAELTGRWEAALRYEGTPAAVKYSRLNIEAKDSAYTASFQWMQFEGSAKGDVLQLRCTSPAGIHGEPCGELTLRRNRKSLEGSGTLFGLKASIVAERPAVAAADTPTVHSFEPRSFHLQFSDAPSPVLRIFPGDTVRTKTLDAAGRDEHEINRSPPGNPQTGPFYIEGAMPGDTLVVHFKRIRPNRDTARIYSNVVLVGAFEPAYVYGLKLVDDWNGTWKLDRAKGTATLMQPSPRLKDLTVKLDPMMGGVGVAPPDGQAISTSDLGAFGGNLDYQGIREGTTLHLPVFTRGALLFLGDGHALQGAGELPGQGLETSMDVEFTVRVIENETLGQPWAEDDRCVMVMGIGGSQTEALQRATTGLTRWLEKRYQLNSAEIAMVLGTSIDYDIAEIVDPHIHVVARISKDILAQIKAEEGK